MREEDLFEPVRMWLEGQGYSVSSEVRDCDIVARHRDRPEELIIVELKTRMSLDLVNQGVRRKELTESVYLAVPLLGAEGHLRNAAATMQTLRRLELGLLYVRFLKRGSRVETALHPRDFEPRNRNRKRKAIIREIDHRYAELDRGGQPTGTIRFSAYRQRALLTAVILAERGELSPQEVRLSGGPEECGRIMSANHYGWFDRVRRGQYRLSQAGAQAIHTYGETIATIRGAHSSIDSR